jgi:hypothetical protein
MLHERNSTNGMVTIPDRIIPLYNGGARGFHADFVGAAQSCGGGGIPSPSGSQREFVRVDPRTLRLPPGRIDGADPAKLARQIARHGKSVDGMPYPLVVRGKDGVLQLVDGVTRASRVGKLLPGQEITVEVLETRPKLDLSRFPSVGDRLP